MSETKQRITVSAFAEGYKKATNGESKVQYVKKHITTTYSPILNKMNILKLMNEKSVVDSESGKYIDMVVSKLNLVMAILVLYTDIEPDKNEEGISLTWEAYDTLKSTGLLEQILEAIGEDIEELMSIQSNVMDTWYAQNKSTEAYVTNLVNVASRKFGVVAGVGMEKLAEVLEDENKMEKVMSALDKVLKRIK